MFYGSDFGNNTKEGGFMSLTIQREFHRESNQWNVILRGEVDISNASKLRSELKAMLNERPAPVTMDIQDLSYIDSTGLGVMIGAYQHMKEQRLSFRLIHPRKNVEKLLKITSLDKIFL